MGALSFAATPLAGLVRVQASPVSDTRGGFMRVFCDQDLAGLSPGLRCRQANLSDTHSRGTVRGMHYQVAPMAESKLIWCLRGHVFDVAVDLRRGSPTYLQWHAVELTAGRAEAIFIPEGFAHGFQALSDDVQLLYLHGNAWNPAHERGLRHDDPRLAIAWPEPVTLVSPRDQAAPLIDATFEGFVP